VDQHLFHIVKLEESDKNVKSTILHALYYGPNDLRVKDFASSGFDLDESREDTEEHKR